jgi:hypothetical protein
MAWTKITGRKYRRDGMCYTSMKLFLNKPPQLVIRGEANYPESRLVQWRKADMVALDP